MKSDLKKKRRQLIDLSSKLCEKSVINTGGVYEITLITSFPREQENTLRKHSVFQLCVSQARIQYITHFVSLNKYTINSKM